MAFRRGGILPRDMKFYYNNVELSVANHFFYLGMTSEGTEMLILALNSKTGQSVVHSRQNFLFGFSCQRDDIFRHVIGLISDSIRNFLGYSR